MGTAWDRFITGSEEIASLPADKQTEAFKALMASEGFTMAASENPVLFIQHIQEIIESLPVKEERAEVFATFNTTEASAIVARQKPWTSGDSTVSIIKSLADQDRRAAFITFMNCDAFTNLARTNPEEISIYCNIIIPFLPESDQALVIESLLSHRDTNVRSGAKFDLIFTTIFAKAGWTDVTSIGDVKYPYGFKPAAYCSEQGAIILTERGFVGSIEAFVEPNSVSVSRQRNVQKPLANAFARAAADTRFTPIQQQGLERAALALTPR